MTWRNKNLADIEATDFDSLVQDGIEEGTHLDFKRILVSATNEDRKRFLADICAFANAHGGDLVFGIQENDEGVALAVTALEFNPDHEILLGEHDKRWTGSQTIRRSHASSSLWWESRSRCSRA